MKIGVPTEIKSDEYRIAITPAGVRELTAHGHEVLVQTGAGEGSYGDELVRSLDVFIENNGHWEKAANELYCHRHTLRYRIRRIEQLTGRDFSNARDRIEFWLALRGRELAR